MNHWLTSLETYTEEQLLRKPSDEEWSLGQVYNHLINSALLFHLKQIELCAAGKGTVKADGKT
ncbi:MAG: DinB family protein, partial [Bacteroidota bacterium]